MSSSLATRKLQFIDRWVGIPVCGVLNLVRLLQGGRRSEALPERLSKILFVKFAEQGSTVLAYQAILRAIEMVGRENICLLHNPYLHTSQSFQLMVEALGQAPAQLPTTQSQVPKVNSASPEFGASSLHCHRRQSFCK